MNLAAIDIGSNAARLIISRVIKRKSGKIRFKKIHYLRYPLRLGKEVFDKGEIGEKKIDEIFELCNVLRDLMKLFDVKHYMACATSAMREASNNEFIIEQVFKETSIKIDIIDGKKEAKLINHVLYNFLENDQNCIHIDVGGGSTEINIFIKGSKLQSESFKLGSIRNKNEESFTKEMDKIKSWLDEVTKEHRFDYAIGTGGNIRKIHKLCANGSEFISLKELMETKIFIDKHSIKERIEVLLLNPDRADVIVPAAHIYEEIMNKCSVDQIMVPDIGLKDGIMRELYESSAFLFD